MIRTQIQLTEKQSEGLRQIAAKRHVSLATVIRQSVDKTLAEQSEASNVERRQRAAAVSGAFRSGKSDIGVNHDKYLADIYK